MKVSNKRHIIALAAGTLVSGITGLVGNIASDNLPAWLDAYLWLSWPIFLLFLTLSIITALSQVHLQHPTNESTEHLLPVLKHLSSEDLERRIQVARSLGEKRQKSAIPALAKRLVVEHDPEAFYWIAIALGEIGGKDAKKALLSFERQFDGKMTAIHRLAINDALTLIEQEKVSQRRTK